MVQTDTVEEVGTSGSNRYCGGNGNQWFKQILWRKWEPVVQTDTVEEMGTSGSNRYCGGSGNQWFKQILWRKWEPVVQTDTAEEVGTSGQTDTVEEVGTSGQTDTAEELGLDPTHPQEASIQHHTQSPDLKPSGEAEERPASQQLEARH